MKKVTTVVSIGWVIAAVLAVAPAYAKESAIVIFDASGSMKKPVDGKPKIEMAREVMGSLMQDWNPDIDLGLMVYGHRTRACDDIEMLTPLGKPEPEKLVNAIRDLKPKGETPIAASLRQAAEQLAYAESPATVILISDGEESCHADPCAAAAELKRQGVDFTAHVIGFDVDGKDQNKAKAQLKCVADNTGGKFFTAGNAQELKTALAETAKAVAHAPVGGGRDNPIWMQPDTTYEGNDSAGPVYYKFRVPPDTKARFHLEVKETKPVFGINTASTVMTDDGSGNFFVLEQGASPIARGNKTFAGETHTFVPKDNYRYYLYRVSSFNNNITFKVNYTLLDYRDQPYTAATEEVTPLANTAYWVKRGKATPGNGLETATPLTEGEIASGLTKGERFYRFTLPAGQGAAVVVYAQGGVNKTADVRVLDTAGKVVGKWDPLVGESQDWKRGIIPVPSTEQPADYTLKITEDWGMLPYEIFYLHDEKALYQVNDSVL